MAKKATTTKPSGKPGRLLAASKAVLAEIDRLALVCNGSDELRAAIAEAEAAS